MKEPLLQDNHLVIKKIKTYLESKGIRQTWLAKQLNISRGYLFHMLKGDCVMHQKTLDKINEALQTDFKID